MFFFFYSFSRSMSTLPMWKKVTYRSQELQRHRHIILKMYPLFVTRVTVELPYNKILLFMKMYLPSSFILRYVRAEMNVHAFMNELDQKDGGLLGSRTTPHPLDNSYPDDSHPDNSPTGRLPTRTTPHQDNSPLGQIPTRTTPH